MQPTLQTVVEYLNSKGIDVLPQKSTHQINMEMATMLLTLVMSEVDYLRKRIETLEKGGVPHA
ncbi:hypothetical protein [Paenibacillus sp. L3-i20]|uniref:hypothetical protein n=1 Tax=Paenibacillus sp. L3-i20 TaxID=2905833 RepID=UPI001EDDFC80|nr:hypothetical protein [Paenibacillus sp. L3-i20]GKU75647.1 hypothetical protein L3i20_v200440 [Paenibacillus sp. L3-i20]